MDGFKNVFVTGPGYQMAQIFVEKIFEEHVDWVQLIKTNDNFKNILQVKIQKEFQVTPDYIEMSRDLESGFEMGVYLCLGQAIHQVKCADAEPFSKYGSFASIKEALHHKPKTSLADKKMDELERDLQGTWYQWILQKEEGRTCKDDRVAPRGRKEWNDFHPTRLWKP